MKKLLIAAGICCFSQILPAQERLNETAGRPYIEVTGTGEMEITPDEIYVTITLQESREKDNIQKQEDALKQNLKELGIDLSNLTMRSADADFGKIRAFKKEVLVTKSYILKLSDATVLSRVYERLDKINVQDAFISRVDHSRILEYTKETRIKAIKAAREKAVYLLAAIEKQTGQPLQVTEIENYIQVPFQRNMMATKSLASNVRMADRYVAEEQEIGFKKIKIKSAFLVKYEIK